MNPFMNMNAGMPQQNMNFNQDLFQQFTHIYNNMPQQNLNGMNFNQNLYQQFMNQNGMNMNMHAQNNNNMFNNNNVFQLFNMFLQWYNNNMNNNMNMNNLNNGNNINLNNNMGMNNFNNGNNINMNNNMNNLNNRNNFNMNNLNNGNNGNMNNININNENDDNINNNNFNINGGNNRNEEDITGYREILPRGDNMLNFDNEYPEEDSENLRNVIFKTSSGFRVTIVVPYYETINNLLRLFAKKLGIGENTLGNNIFFIFDATYLKPNDQRAIYELTQSNIPTITVIDSGNVLGA